jgi:hypothetical protein
MRPGFSSQLARPRRSCCYLLFLSLFVGNKIRAGIYLLYPSVFDDIKLKLTSIEREVFPRIAADAGLFAMVLLGFWTSCACTWTTSRTPACACTWTPCSRRTTSRTPVRHGTRETTFTGMCLYLDSMRKELPHKLASGAHVLGNVLVHETVVVGEGSLIGHAYVAAVIPLSQAVPEEAETERRNKAVGGASVFRNRRGGGVTWRAQLGGVAAADGELTVVLIAVRKTTWPGGMSTGPLGPVHAGQRPSGRVHWAIRLQTEAQM